MIEKDLIRQLNVLQLQLDNLIKPERGLQLTLVDKDADGDMDPLTSTDWDGDSYSTGTGTIDWNADFGVPANAKGVQLLVRARDSGSAAGAPLILLKAKSTSTAPSIIHSLAGYANNTLRNECGMLAIASDGTSYYDITATGAGTMDVWIYVVGWYM